SCTCGDENQTCKNDSDCAAGKRCGAGVCIANAECTTDAECVASDPRKRCDVEGKTFACVFRDGFADECDVSRPCAFGQFCSTLLGRCLDSGSARDCTRRSQCPAAQICDRQANKCIPDKGCYGDAFCETGELCDLVAHICRSQSIDCTSCMATGACEG